MVSTGAILVGIFSLVVFFNFLQIVAGFVTRRKMLRLIDEGYYFVEVRRTWGRRELRPVHPSSVDMSTDVPRVMG